MDLNCPLQVYCCMRTEGNSMNYGGAGIAGLKGELIEQEWQYLDIDYTHREKNLSWKLKPLWCHPESLCENMVQNRHNNSYCFLSYLCLSILYLMLRVTYTLMKYSIFLYV